MRHRHLEIAALALTVVLHALAIARVVPELHAWGVAAICIVAGYALADLLTGIAHWFGDQIASESWPWLGVHFVRPFREHHVDPLDITRHDVIETNGNNAIVTLVPIVILAIVGPMAPYGSACLIAASAAFLATNQIHQWAHAPRAPRIVRALQRLRVILPPDHHQRHHTTHDRAFCVTSGWMNSLLDRMVTR